MKEFNKERRKSYVFTQLEDYYIAVRKMLEEFEEIRNKSIIKICKSNEIKLEDLE